MPSEITATTRRGTRVTIDTDGRALVNGEVVGEVTRRAGGYGWILYSVASRALFETREDARLDLAAQMEVTRDA